MKKPFLLLAIKSAIILYFAACTSIEHFTVARSATPIVTRGSWKINLHKDANNDKTNDLAGYTFTFSSSGVVKANKNGVIINGNWAEDNISNHITIDLGTTDPSLKILNSNWSIQEVSGKKVNLQYDGGNETEKLDITRL